MNIKEVPRDSLCKCKTMCLACLCYSLRITRFVLVRGTTSADCGKSLYLTFIPVCPQRHYTRGKLCTPKWCRKTFKKLITISSKGFALMRSSVVQLSWLLLLSRHTCKQCVTDSPSGCDWLWPCLWGTFMRGHWYWRIWTNWDDAGAPWLCHTQAGGPGCRRKLVDLKPKCTSQKWYTSLLPMSLAAVDFCCVLLLWLLWMTECSQWTEISPLLPGVVWLWCSPRQLKSN